MDPGKNELHNNFHHENTIMGWHIYANNMVLRSTKKKICFTNAEYIH